jgi:uncharacterized protein (DUF488 family)
MAEPERHTLYTIGHSNHKTEDFLGLLRRHKITLVADVRSAPYSRYCPQFNKDILAANLKAAGIEYIFLGKELGAHPDDSSCFQNGCVNLQRIANRKEFRRGLQRLLTDSLKCRIALMCAEKEPLQCHRTILISRYLRHDLCIKHILADGGVEEHLETEHRLLKMLEIEPPLFEPAKTEKELIEQAYDQQAQRISLITGIKQKPK